MTENNNIRKVRIQINLEKRTLIIENGQPFQLDQTFCSAEALRTYDGVSHIILNYNDPNSNLAHDEAKKLERNFSQTNVLQNREHGDISLSFNMRPPYIKIRGYLKATITN